MTTLTLYGKVTAALYETRAGDDFHRLEICKLLKVRSKFSTVR
jgi:hypothetical protein